MFAFQRGNATDSKLLPPPSPPAMLLSSNINASDTGKMNAPLLRSPISARFQSPPLQQHPNAKGTTYNNWSVSNNSILLSQCVTANVC